METLKELKAIIENAPSGSEYICSDMDYYDDNCRVYCDGRWWDCENPVMTRSLSDIKLIIELMELNQNMHTTVAGYLHGKEWARWNEINVGKFNYELSKIQIKAG